MKGGGEEAKKTLGRRKIPIEKIDKKSNRQVAFSKRRMGLFKKASELSVLCGAEIAMLVESPAKKIFAFGEPSVLDQFLGLPALNNPSMAQMWALESNRIKYAEAEKRLEREKEMKKTIKEGFWWNEDIEGKELDELEVYLESLKRLMGDVSRRLEEVKKVEHELDNGGIVIMPLEELMNGEEIEMDDDWMMMLNSFLSDDDDENLLGTCSSSSSDLLNTRPM